MIWVFVSGESEGRFLMEIVFGFSYRCNLVEEKDMGISNKVKSGSGEVFGCG